MKSLTPIALFILLLLSSCGGNSNGPSTPTDNTQYFPTQEELLSALSQSTVVCENAWSNCPTNVAKLTFWNKLDDGYGLAVCSGTLIDEEYIITNSHCIPNNLNDDDDCSMQIIVQFPRSGSMQKEKVACKKVVQKFPMKEDQPDLAVLKIQKSFYNRKETTILKNQFSEGLNVTAFTMNPDDVDSMKGTIVRKDCQVSLNNILTLEENSNSGNVLIYGDNCNVIGGNSGSGLFNQDGKLIGVIHQKIEKGLLSDALNNEGLGHKPLTYMGVVANISCLKSLTFSLGKGCEPQGIGAKFSLIGDYLDQLVIKNGLQGENQDHIRLTIENNLSVSLSLDQNVSYKDSFSKMKSLMVNIFTEAKSILKYAARKVSL